MTREEAIKWFEALLHYLAEDECNKEARAAANLAIEALLGPQPDPITGLVPCGCGGKLVLHNCLDREYMTTFYIECDNEVCGLSVGRRYDPINHCRRGEFTAAQSAIKAANRAMGYTALPRPGAKEQSHES